MEIPDDAAETIQTVGDAIRFLESSFNKGYKNSVGTLTTRTLALPAGPRAE